MAAAVAAPPTPLVPTIERHDSPKQFAATAPGSSNNVLSAASTSEPPAPKRARSNDSPDSDAEQSGSVSVERSNLNGKTSPNSVRTGPPPIVVKKEPGSPSMPSSRPRPKRLDLSSSISHSRGPSTARPSAPLTSRESAGLAIQDMGLACLSPGFQTQDPAMREQLQRSLNVRDQQRMIIEARQKGSGKPDSSHEDSEGPSNHAQDTTLFGIQTRTPGTAKRKGPPAGLSINAPSAHQFANDRVIQSAPLHQTFTGLRPEGPYSRHIAHQPSNLSQTSHIHHVPATQTNNRLPPIADVFANDSLAAPRQTIYPTAYSPGHSSHSDHRPPLPSPSFPPSQKQQQQAPPLSARAREFRSAEEAVVQLSGGREPKLVHYGGVQPPTPPSPMPSHGQQHQQAQHHFESYPGAQQRPPPQPLTTFESGGTRPDMFHRISSMNGRRRDRDEYERDNGSPPSSFNRQEAKRTTFAVRGDEHEREREEDWKRNMSGEQKREEFLGLCERAWDLFHS